MPISPRRDQRSRRFRQDLLFRLNTVEIELPPLRDRREDIAELVAHYLDQYARRYARPGVTISAMAMAADDWPGNVCALRHAIERAVILAGDAPLAPDDFPLSAPRSILPIPPDPAGAPDFNLDRIERQLVEGALRQHGYHISAAAGALGVSRAALYRRVEKHGL